MRSAFVMLVVAETLLLATIVVHATRGSMPFATEYVPKGFDLLVGCGMLGCALAFVAACYASPRAAKIGCAVTVIASIAAVTAYLVYHSARPVPMVPDGFRGYLEPATAFHEQLAFPCFVTLGAVAAILGLAKLGNGRSG